MDYDVNADADRVSVYKISTLQLSKTKLTQSVLLFASTLVGISSFIRREEGYRADTLQQLSSVVVVVIWFFIALMEAFHVLKNRRVLKLREGSNMSEVTIENRMLELNKSSRHVFGVDKRIKQTRRSQLVLQQKTNMASEVLVRSGGSEVGCEVGAGSGDTIQIELTTIMIDSGV